MRALLVALSLSLLFVGSAEAKRKKYRKAPQAFSAKSYVIAGADGVTLSQKDSSTVRPIASISKLMVALLASEQDPAELLFVPSQREVRSTIPRGVDYLSRHDLMELALVKSDNLAAQVLCSNIANCVDKMNEKAAELGMTKTSFAEPTGLDQKNVSTADDLVKLALATMNKTAIQTLSSMPDAKIYTDSGIISIKNTNPLTSKIDVVVSKTGFTRPAGGCLLMVFNSESGQRILILLGSRNSRTRMPDAERLMGNGRV